MGEAKPGDRVEVETADKKYVGILMPRPELADKKHVTLKLDSGYNVGVEKGRIKSMKVLFHECGKEEFTLKEHVRDPSKPSISILATGGTIASRVDYLTGGVHSAFSADELISAVPELEDVANVKGKQVFNKFSENMVPADWAKLAEEAYSELKSSDGVVITHGTDTMGYSAAALSFMLQTPKPVVFTGAQRSSDRGSSDAAQNLVDAALVASKSGYPGVCVVMHGGMSDTCSLIHRGTRVRKLHSSRRDAFHTVNEEPIGTVEGGELCINHLPGSKKLELDAKLEESVSLLKYYPGLTPKTFDAVVKSGVEGIVLEGTGLGHVSERIFDSIKAAISSGVSVAMTTQTLYGRVNMNVYATGRQMLDMGVIPCGDMLPETAYVKLMWVLAHASGDKVSEMMRSSLAGEINDRTPIL